jgi:hypothetical protein
MQNSETGNGGRKGEDDDDVPFEIRRSPVMKIDSWTS